MKALPLSMLAASALTSFLGQAAELDIKLTNLTQGLHFTPVLIAAHNSEHKLFNVAMPASTALQTMAEGGNLEHILCWVKNSLHVACLINNDLPMQPLVAVAPTRTELAV